MKIMTNTNMLQILIDGQVLIREDIKDVKKEVGKVEKNLTVRMDDILPTLQGGVSSLPPAN